MQNISQEEAHAVVAEVLDAVGVQLSEDDARVPDRVLDGLS